MQMDVKCTTFDEHDPVPEDVPLLVDPSVWGLTLVDQCHLSSSQSPAAGSGWPLSGRHQPAASPSRALIAVIFAVVLVTVVVTFLLLMRAGYRWARTVLTGGALASILYTASSLFTVQRPTAAALIYAGQASSVRCCWPAGSSWCIARTVTASSPGDLRNPSPTDR